MIISAGYRIGPFEVESALRRAPGTSSRRRPWRHRTSGAATSSRRSSVLADGVEPSDELAAEIQRNVRERLGAYAYPREIEFVDDLPKTLTGKIRRIELRRREAERRAPAP